MLRATALYRNVSETAEELSFEPGDQLVVIEQDVGGAVGWWLCSLHGRTGIVPGNRVRLNVGSTVGGNRFRMDCSPPVTPASRFSGGRHGSPQDQVVVPHKFGNMYVYDSPRHTNTDYDIPPSRYNALSNGTLNRSSPVSDTSSQNLDALSTFSHSNDIYDIPPASWNSPKTGELLYDVPPSMCGFESDKISLSNRSSVLSTMSIDSRSSMASGRSGSSPAMSSRSSIDVCVSNEIYDIPRLSADRSVAPPSKMPPLCANYSFGQDQDSYAEDNVLAKGDTPLTSDHLERGACTSIPWEDGEVYDTPKSFSAKTEYDNPVYDIPPVSSVEKAKTLNKPISTPDSGLYDELRSGASRQLTALRDSVLVGIDKLHRMAIDSENQRQRSKDSYQSCLGASSSELVVQSSVRELLQLGEEIAKRETDFARCEEIRQRCDKLNQLLVRAVEQLDQLSAPRPDESCTQYDAELIDSLTVIRTAVSELYLLLTRQSTVPGFNKAPSLTEASTVSGGSPRSMVGRGLPPPPVMPKPLKGAPPAKMDISERPLPALPSECPAENISSKKSAVIFSDKTATDYDYVLIVDESERKQLSAPRETSFPVRVSSPADGGLPADQQHVQPVVNGHNNSLNQADRELLSFYEAQVRAHAPVVDAAVSDFCQYASSSGGHVQMMSPDVFVQRGKLVVLAAHKLVYIGDSVARHIGDATVGSHVAAAANELCDQLKVVVTATKEAAFLSPHNAVLRLRAVESVKAAAEACVTLSKVMSSFVA